MPTLSLYPLLGMDERYRAPSNAAAKIENMRWSERGAWHRAYGYTQLLDTQSEAASAVPVSSAITLHETDLGGRRWLVYERKESDAAGAKLAYLDLSSNTEKVIESGRHWSDAPWRGTQFLSVGEDLYYVNGVDRPGRWNTLRTEEPGYSSRPGPPIVLDYDRDASVDANADDYGQDQLFDRFSTPADPLASGVGEFFASFGGRYGRGVGQVGPDSPSGAAASVMPVAEYGYGVTYVNALGQESPMSKVVFGRAQTHGSSGRRSIAIAVRDVPQNAVRVRVWRTMNLTPAQYRPVFAAAWDGAALTTAGRMVRYMPERPTLPAYQQLQEQELYLLQDFPASSPLLFTDTKGDEHLGQRYDHEATGLWPKGAALIAWFAGRLCLAGMPSHPGRLVYSHPLYREQFPDGNAFELPSPITALHSTGPALYVFTARSIHLVYQDELGAPRMRTLTQSQGTNSPNAVVEIPRAGLCFINGSGIWRVTSGEPERLSHPIQKSWDERVTVEGFQAAWAWIDRRGKEVWFHVPADGLARPSLGFVYHYEIGQWSLRPGWGLAGAVQADDGTGTTFMAGWDTANGLNGILVYGPGYDDWAGTTFDGVYTAAWQAFGDVGERVHVRSIEVEALGYTNRPLTVDWRADRARTWLVPDNDVSPDHIELYSEVKVWGSGARGGTWDTDTWKDYEPTLTRVDTFGANMIGLGLSAREFQARVTAAGASSGRVGLISISLIYDGAHSNLRVLNPAQGAP